MNALKSLVFALAITPFAAQAGPSQCWYYLHGKLSSPSVEACLEKGEIALLSEGLDPQRGDSSDSYISSLKGENSRTTAQVLCYEVNGRRGKVMAFITVAGARACPVAENLFLAMKEGESDL